MQRRQFGLERPPQHLDRTLEGTGDLARDLEQAGRDRIGQRSDEHHHGARRLEAHGAGEIEGEKGAPQAGTTVQERGRRPAWSHEQSLAAERREGE